MRVILICLLFSTSLLAQPVPPPTVDTNANTLCSGSTTYLDGEGNCDDISSVYEAAGITESDISDLSHTTDTNANTICSGTGNYLDGEGNCDALEAVSTDIKAGSFGTVIDGGGSAITTGQKGYIIVPYACTISEASVLLDQSGSIVIDVWKDTYANYPPVDADSITASAPPTVSSATKSQDSTLTGWTTSVSAGDVIGFNVDSITTATTATLIIQCDKS